MGRFLKNSVARTANSAIHMPRGASGDRPSHPLNGAMRYNTSINRVEVYYNSIWNISSKEDQVAIVKDTFAGDNSTADYTMSSYYSAGYEAQVIVYLNAIWQNPGINYTFNGSTNIHFTSAPGPAAVIVVLHNYATTTTSWPI
jgi:hypothetical protein